MSMGTAIDVGERVVGLISDTHGLLRPEALDALQGSDFIVHAGDIGDVAILEQLSRIAPVTAVRGNNDRGAWAAALPDTARLDVHARRILVIHDLSQLDHDASLDGIDVVVSGHSHRPRSGQRGKILFINPGSAGPRRFRLPISIGRLSIVGDRIDATLVALEVEPSIPPPQRRMRSA